ncbi:MAG: putative peptidoglycan-binding domain-containing protein [Rhodobacteraceae bacterium HLUCCA08]|nr:MAG: putative peptidoglycan-binding domain-containing protein [Rhodobacteraceae bacterium HLUCCA08]
MIRTVAPIALFVLSGCVSGPGPGMPSEATAPPVGSTCTGRAVTPARIETVTEQVLVTPARLDDAGNVLEPAGYQTVTRQQITRDRQEVTFDTPCPDLLTPEFVASLQRALRVRGLYQGPISGVFDPATGRAVRDFQVARGDHDTTVLTLASARALGLVALDRDSLMNR